ncbi:MAG: diguanylate cyclase [Thalassotalea sp.]
MSVLKKDSVNQAPPSTVNEKNQAKAWSFAIFMGVIGALINSIPIPVLPEINLILGNAAFVFVAMHLLPKYTLVAAIITLIPVYFIFGHPWGFLTFGLEAWFISTMRSKGWYVLIADMVYWLAIGMPLTMLIIWFQVADFSTADLFTVFKQGFNGLWYTSIACFLMFVFNEKLHITWRHQSSSHRTLRAKVVYSLVFVTTTALFTATLFISNHFIQSAKNLVDKSLLDNSQNIADVIDFYYDKNEKGVEFASEWLSASPPQYYDFVINKFLLSYPDFKAVYLADLEGDVKYAFGQGSQNKQVSLAAQSNDANNVHWSAEDDFLFLTMNQNFISKTNKSEQYVVDALLDLQLLKSLPSAKINELPVSTVIVDQKGRVISASPRLKLVTLAPFNHQQVKNIEHELILPTVNNQRYLYQMVATANGWQVYSLIAGLSSANHIKSEYLSVFIILFFTLIVTTYFADQYGRRLTKPIHFIIGQLSKQKEQKMPSKLSASKEVVHLYEEIVSNRNTLYNYQELLEERVIERTKELNEANQKLEKLALFDGLTQVHNRRYLDDNFAMVQKSADRNTALMALVMVDLDFFKKLNDNYGHLTGDKCLVEVARLIKHAFDRGSDMVVRFGGEEFIIVAPYITPAALVTKLETLRVTIEEQVFVAEQNVPFKITASFGAVIADASFSTDVLQWIHVADECLYQAKDAGRNCVRITDKIARVG